MKRGRPETAMDLAEVEKLGMLGATAAEMAAWFNVGVRTIERRMGKTDGDYRMAYDRGYGRLKISLRRQQIEAAKGGNVTMLIWLGKQLLGQADKQETKAEVSQKVVPMTLTPEDEAFLKRKANLISSSFPDDGIYRTPD